MDMSSKEINLSDINVNTYIKKNTAHYENRKESLSEKGISLTTDESDADFKRFNRDISAVDNLKGRERDRKNKNISSEQKYEEHSPTERNRPGNNSLVKLFENCWHLLLQSLNKHWKVWIACLAIISVILSIIVIVLICLLQQSDPPNGNKTDDSTDSTQYIKTICDYHICLNNGTCTSYADTFECICKEGYFGEYCQFTPCSNYKCLNNATCVVKNYTGTCQCIDGYSGEFCGGSPCTNISCQNGGICHVSGSSFTCSCPSGTSGTYCEETPCLESGVRCLNGGTCLFISHVPTCACLFEFYGEACEKRCEYGTQSFACTFEDEEHDECFLQNDLSDDLDWNRNSGSTPSSRTGPGSAIEGHHYLYFEASNPAQEDQVASMISKKLLSGCKRCLQFSYHMYGSGIGDLNVFLGNKQIWTRSNDQGNSWNTVYLDVPQSVNESIRFEAVRGSGISGDIAIDNVQFTPGSCL